MRSEGDPPRTASRSIGNDILLVVGCARERLEKISLAWLVGFRKRRAKAGEAPSREDNHVSRNLLAFATRIRVSGTYTGAIRIAVGSCINITSYSYLGTIYNALAA